MAFQRGRLVGLLVAAVFLSGYPAARGAEEKAPADQREIQRLVEQLGNDDFATREKATRQLLDRGEAVLPALQQALQSPDLEVRRRAERITGEIKAKAEERAIQLLLAEVNQVGLDQFITRMVKEEGFATDERWRVVMKLAQAMAVRASEFGGGGGWLAPGMDVAKLKRAGERQGANYREARVLVNGLRSATTSVERCIFLSSGPVGNITHLCDSVVLVNGDIGYCTSIENCIVFCRGNIGGATGVTGSVILATGRLESATGIEGSLLQLGGVGPCTRSRNNVYLNLSNSTAVHTEGDRSVPTERGPLQMLRFSAPAAPGGKPDRPPGK